MSKYIKDFKLSGIDYCVVIINGNDEFKNLDNKTKLAYMGSSPENTDLQR